MAIFLARPCCRLLSTHSINAPDRFQLRERMLLTRWGSGVRRSVVMVVTPYLKLGGLQVRDFAAFLGAAISFMANIAFHHSDGVDDFGDCVDALFARQLADHGGKLDRMLNVGRGC